MLRSAEIERAASFYSTLGLQFEKHAHGNGQEHYASEVEGFVFEIYPLRGNKVPTTEVRIGFRVVDLDEVVKRLAAVGATIVTAPANSEWGRRAVLKDFDGHKIELTSFQGLSGAE